MRNLKKVLSLVLCMAMMLSVMVVGAGAAFKDQEKIVNDEAVDMCSALNIINGYTDGSYRPEGTITRAEACKMICIALNGGKEPVLGTNATATFTDIKGHWAEKYIEYCVSEGIVAGIGGGKFNPNGNVTGSQFAKMLLIALGFNAEHAKFLGTAWEVNVNVKATQKGLYEDLETMDPAVALSRDNAAQMIWNALNAILVEYDYTLVSNNGTLTSQVVVKDNKDKDTLLEDKYGVIDTDLTTGILAGASYSTTKEEYTYTILSDVEDAITEFVSDDCYVDLMGHNVCFVAAAKDDVYGVFADESVELVAGLVGDIDYTDVAIADDETVSGSFEANDVDYDVDKYMTVQLATIVDNAVAVDKLNAEEIAELFPYYTYSAIDWEDDGDVDVVIVMPVTYGEVKYVGSDYVRIDGMNDGKNMETEDYNVYEGIAKEDMALLSGDLSLKTDGNITKLEKQTAEVESVSSDDTAVVGGTSYDALVELTAGEEYDFYVINGYIVEATPVDAVADLADFLVVTGTPVMTTSGYYQVDVMFTDGTTDTITVKELTYLKSGVATTVEKGAAKIASVVADGVMFTYDVSGGKYELTTMAASDLSGFDAESLTSTFAFVGKAGSDAAYFTVNDAKTSINDDAVVIVVDDGDYSVTTGAALKKIADAEVIFAAAEEDKGYDYVSFAYVATAESGSSDEVYGFVTSAVVEKTDADGTYYVFDVWTAEGLKDDIKTIYAEDLDGSAPSEQDFITFTTDENGDINMIASANVQDAAVAITGLNADGDMVRFNGEAADFEIDEDTVVLYINYQDEAGELTGTIEVAETTDATDGTIEVGSGDDVTYYLANANYVESAGILKLLVIDFTGDWNGIED